jgi:putative oxidoreductase
MWQLWWNFCHCSIFCLDGRFAEAVGGLLLVCGFQTRIASFLVIYHASCYLYATNTKRIMELPCSHGILWVAMFFLILGSGRFGIDYLL